jgi:hypothetical protein
MQYSSHHPKQLESSAASSFSTDRQQSVDAANLTNSLNNDDQWVNIQPIIKES